MGGECRKHEEHEIRVTLYWEKKRKRSLADLTVVGQITVKSMFQNMQVRKYNRAKSSG